VGCGSEEEAGEVGILGRTPCGAAGTVWLPGVLRLRKCSASRSTYFAQDDKTFGCVMRKGKAAKTVDEYLSNTREPARSTLKHIRAVIQSVVPKDTTEVISYGMPMFKFNGMLVGYAAFKNHCSLFPTGSGVLDRFEKELKGYRTSKGTIQFPADKPLADALVKKIVRARVKENREWD
jgi:uncharacterized protein YdhG (YjbR/CyaY superfamily)